MNRRVGEVRSGCFRVWGGGARERERQERGEEWSVGEWFEVNFPSSLRCWLWLLHFGYCNLCTTTVSEGETGNGSYLLLIDIYGYLLKFTIIV
jgi:hypothetical protein